MRKSELEDGKYWKTQKEVVCDYLKDKTATASMVEAATGIHQKCITWIKCDLQENGYLWETEKKFCQETGRRAWYLTTNPDLKPEDTQYSMFR